MKKNKLFNILVTGGALLTSSGAMGNESEAETGHQIVFCASTDQCDEVYSCSETGDIITELVVKKGLECCWGTSCADVSIEE